MSVAQLELAAPVRRHDNRSPAATLDALGAVGFHTAYLRMPQLAALHAHDARRGSDYARTLRAYLDMHGNVAAAAEHVGVHVNTFRYRLTRLVAISGLDLDDPDERLVCALELSTTLGPSLVRTGEVAVAALRVVGGDDEASGRLSRLVTLSWDAFRTSAWCDVTEHTVYSVVPVGSAATHDVIGCAVRGVVSDAERNLGITVVAGIGPAVDAAHEDVSRRLADDVVRAVQRRGGDPIGSLDDVRTSIVLAAVAAAATERPSIDGGAVSRLAAHDRANGTVYVESLRAFLDCFGDVRRAAARSYVHVRTFRYRLRRIAQLGGLRLDDPAVRLTAELALRLR